MLYALIKILVIILRCIFTYYHSDIVQAWVLAVIIITFSNMAFGIFTSFYLMIFKIIVQ